MYLAGPPLNAKTPSTPEPGAARVVEQKAAARARG